jgi:asparagine synthetase B (glutamine-hydrolysing)
MRSAMAYYGPHGGGYKLEGSLGMGHLLLETNPEDAYESQPVVGERGLVVSAARLDNRAELLEALHVSGEEAVRQSDGHLVGLAFDRWGEELSAHLQGDWALAGWDRRERRLLLARDACGSATLYYYEGKGFLAFASSLKALLALPGIEKKPETGAVKLVIAPGETVTGTFPTPVRTIDCGLPGPSSATFSLAVLVPGPLGVKVTDTVQFEPAATVAQAVVAAKSLLLAPETVTPEKVSGIVCLLVTVTVWATLVVPSNCAGKVRELGVRTTAVRTVSVAGLLQTGAN